MPCPVSARDIRRFLTAVDAVVPSRAAVITVLVDLTALRRRYVRPHSLAWRDAGCQLAVLHLTAEALGLGSCLLGLTGQILAEAIGSPRLVPMGIILVGRRRTGTRTKR